MATTIRIPPPSRTYDIRQFVQAGESLVRDGSGPGNNSAILQRAIDALTALSTPAQIFTPNGRYVLAQSGVNNAVPYGVQWKTRVGLRGESEAGTVFLSDATSTPFFGAYGPQLVDSASPTSPSTPPRRPTPPTPPSSRACSCRTCSAPAGLT